MVGHFSENELYCFAVKSRLVHMRQQREDPEKCTALAQRRDIFQEAAVADTVKAIYSKTHTNQKPSVNIERSGCRDAANILTAE
jgi:hypothetical protein